MINKLDFSSFKGNWERAEPFSHIVIDNFLSGDVANCIAEEVPDFDSPDWYVYDNAIEIKKSMNSWDKFGKVTYSLFWYLNSEKFISKLELLTSCKLYADFGLNGGGIHSHKSGGKLNTHLDYSIHPKLKMQRRLNLIVYVTRNWQKEWGGELGLWEHNEIQNKPGALVSSISPLFNRAVLFDTTQNSWHGLPDPICCPPDITRNSIAVYYLCEPDVNAADRGRALFAPYKDQESDPEVMALIKKRSDIVGSQTVYNRKQTIT